MSSFANAVSNQDARTANGARALASTSNACVDLFYKIGASRGQDIIPAFVAAFVEDKERALRIAAWARDVRGGAGEREIFRAILAYLDVHSPRDAARLLFLIPTVGRYDDLFTVQSVENKGIAHTMLFHALQNESALAAKWTPRKGKLAAELRHFFGWTPKFYRKTLVNLTKVVEQDMCAKNWDGINFSHVPSQAHARYKKAFARNSTTYAAYVESLVNQTDPKVKINAGAIYPYEVLRGLDAFGSQSSVIQAQWDALENFLGDARVLPLVDVSGSMTNQISKSTLTCMDVAVSLGLYCADKNVGAFKDIFMTFSNRPALLKLSGNIVQKHQQMRRSDWGMSTDLEKAMSLILSTAIKGKVPESEMPTSLMIFSDMQFNQCVKADNSALDMIREKFAEAGYSVPNVVFWNLNDASNVPASANDKGVALVSGFSPAIMASVLSAKADEFTPEAVMLKAINSDRYALIG